MALEFGILGPLEVRADAQPVELRGAKQRMLLAALLLERNRPVDPERLATALWGDDAAHGSINAVRVQVSRLRSALGAPEALVTTPSGYELRVAETDADRFEELTREGKAALAAGRHAEAAARLRTALKLWRGPALADVASETFAQPEIQRLEEQRLAALEARIDADLASGVDRELVAELQELAGRHPLREHLQGQLMLALYRTGRQADALAGYRTTRDHLADTLGLEPSPALRELERQILNHDRSLAAPERPRTRAQVTLVGRDTELAHARKAIEHRGLLLIAGEAGIGKTTLARALAPDALFGACDEEPLAPYQPFAEALRGFVTPGDLRLDLQELARLLPELGSPPPTSDRHRLFDAVAQALATKPLLVIDDLHWADAATLLMLRYALRHVRDLVVVATSRDAADATGPLAELAVDLRRDGGFERLKVAGLDVEATRALLGDSGSDAEAIQARTAGNPFFIQQVIRSGTDTVPEGVKALIGQRVARLGPEATDILRVAAAAGAEVDFTLLQRVCGDTALDAVEDAVAAGLLVETPSGFAFVHALAREAVYEAMSGPRRARTHQRLAEALHGPAAALAHHYLEARRLTGIEPAVAALMAAAEEAVAALDWEHELQHYETAVRLLDETGSTNDEARCRALLRLANRYVRLGRDFRPLCRRAADIARRHGWLDVLGEAATGIARVNEYGVVDEEAVEVLEAALVDFGDRDHPWRARVLGRLAETLVLDGREPERRDALTREGLAIARRLNVPHALLGALTARLTGLDGPEHTGERIALLTEALDVAEGDPDGFDWETSLLRERSVLHLLAGDVASARRDGRQLANAIATHRLEHTFEGAESLRWEGIEAALDGRLDDAERIAERYDALMEELDDPDAEHLRLAQLLSIRMEQDRLEELRDGVEERAEHSPLPGPWRALRCLMDARAGRRERALEELRALAADDCAAIPPVEEWLAAVSLLADACADLGDRETAPTLLRLLEPFAAYLPGFLYGSGQLGPVALRVGRLATLLGRTDEAQAAFAQAIAISEAIPAPIWAKNAKTASAGGLHRAIGTSAENL